MTVQNCSNLDTLEHVVANISFKYTTRGDLKLTLISPSGTPSEILSFRKNDLSDKAIKYFPFMTIFNWGESPIGKWKLIIETRARRDKTLENEGSLNSFSLKFFGYKKVVSNEHREQQKKRELNLRAFVPSNEILEKIYNSELKLSRQTRIINKRLLDSNPQIRDILRSLF